MPTSKPEREYDLSLHGTRLAVVEWGPTDATPLLFIHGWLDNAGSFASLAPLLAGDYRCIALDMPGHGLSEHLPGTVNYQFLDGVQTLFEACEALRLAPVNLVGHSMGGALSMLYAGAFPDKVRRLVSIEAFGPLTRNAEDTASSFAYAVMEHVRRRESKKNVFPDIDTALKARASVDKLPAELWRPIVERNLEPVEGGFSWRSDARLRLPSLLRMTHEQAGSFFEAVTAPVLLLKANHGLPLVAEALAIHGPQMDTLEVRELDGGHHIHLEQPETIARFIRGFVPLDN
ncbi:alpha/beta fold hydrolase [Permianibacter aggregans]|uniref:Pimeloyl-ACP methyl ester carboxylesterase n=1 Tax=Permianibacter aggregans TaxID=1510150 RepID=A0A4R6UT28_9GAMM|nr:alpha/beta hydrolase [Permianibacter aggregans]QGX38677.1 alpha/beta hydrolase [Permianibacter aggregans]TDQ50468.1 pimeloyl-ACP methyl ester carboxylesterase [Permianibacter aggregans]